MRVSEKFQELKMGFKMDREQFKEKYLSNKFFWINNQEECETIQNIALEFGLLCHTGDKKIIEYKLDNYPQIKPMSKIKMFKDDGRGFDYFQKVDMYYESMGKPVDFKEFISDYEKVKKYPHDKCDESCYYHCSEGETLKDLKCCLPYKVYGNKPIQIKEVEIDNSEMYFYQYLPIKFKDDYQLAIPQQLNRLKMLILLAIDDFQKEFGSAVGYYIYVTAKCQYVKRGDNINRPGWHSDGFLTEDINYIWSDSLPTEYVEGEFHNIPQNHEESLELFKIIGYENEVKKCLPNVLYRLDESVIHRCAMNNQDPFLRHFVKISFSKEKYNLIGNSHNYLMKYNWAMKPRELNRNHPNK